MCFLRPAEVDLLLDPSKADSQVGHLVIINTGAVVGHDGHLGRGSPSEPRLDVGVVRDLPDAVLAVGVPAKIKGDRP